MKYKYLLSVAGTMASLRILLWVAVSLVLVDGVLELGLAESCLFWIMQGASGPYAIANPGSGTFMLNSEPEHLILAPTKAASAVGAFAFSIMGFGGIAALWLQRSRLQEKPWARFWYMHWPWLSVLCTLYTLGVVIALNVIIDMHEGQEIDVNFASTLGEDTPYPTDSWALPNFYSAVLNLMLVQNTDDEVATAKTILAHRNTMYSWRWNLVPLIIIQTIVCVLAVLDMRQRRKAAALATALPKSEDGGDHVLQV
jgi:hypothetical protein